MKRFFIGAVLLVSVLILFFFLWNGQRDAAKELAPPEEQVVTIHGETLPEQPNVLLAIDPSSQTILSHLYEGLYRFGKDGTVFRGNERVAFISGDRSDICFSGLDPVSCRS